MQFRSFTASYGYIAFLKISIIALPCFYLFKAHCVPNNLRTLSFGFEKKVHLFRSSPCFHPWYIRYMQIFTVLNLVQTELHLLVAFSALPDWIISLILFNYPIVQNALFKKTWSDIVRILNIPINIRRKI
jgi:hypothetical protein